MTAAKFDPNNIVGNKIRYMSRQELCEFVARLCGLVRDEAGPGGVRGGIYPENISVNEKGELAIGPAKQSDWEGQELQYAAPELYWNGRRSPASDVYSLGLLLYFGATRGLLPFDGECSDPQLRRMSGDEFPVPEAAGRRLGEIIAKATSFKAADRYQSMEELKVVLEGCVKNLYLAGTSSAETIFNKGDDELNDIERMMVGIIEKSDEEPLPEVPAEPEISAGSEPPAEPEVPAEAEIPAEVIMPEEPKVPAAPVVPETKAKPEIKQETVKKPVVRLREEKNPELAPVVPTKPIKPAVQYNKSSDREKKIAEEVKKRRRRSVAVILVLCAALVVVAIVFNALLRDLNEIPTPDNGVAATVAPGYVQDYNDADSEDTGAGPNFIASDDPNAPDIAEPSASPNIPTGESKYEVFVEDVSWTAAKTRCEAKGGYLAVVTSQEELDKIIELADEKNVQMLWLGCHRVDGELVWESDETVDFYPWGTGEPSLMDTGDNVAEDYLLLWYHNGAWVYNDSRSDPVSDYPQWYSGNIAYVCEITE